MDSKSRPQGRQIIMRIILLAEDDRGVGDALKSLLQEYYYKVILVVDGKEAVEQAKNADLLILDKHMPMIPGPIVYNIIRKRNTSMPIILVSGDISNLFAPNNDPYLRVLAKPFNIYNLFHVIEELLGGPNNCTNS